MFSRQPDQALRCFVLGAASALVAVAIYQRFGSHRGSGNSEEVRKGRTSFHQTNNGKKSQIWDSPDLELRMLRKAEAVIQWRTTALTVVIERCTNDHNHSAIMRTAEALGVQNVFIIDPSAVSEHDEPTDSRGKRVQRTQQEIEQQNEHKLFAQNATEWLTIKEFETTTDCLKELKATGNQIWATDLSQEAVALVPELLQEHQQHSGPIIPDKLAIVFGTEAVGCSQELLQASNMRVYLPLRGFADSLNLSVATALVLHHLFLLKPEFVGMATEEERRELRSRWFKKLAQQRLLSSRDKKERGRLLGQISKCKAVQTKLDANNGDINALNKDQQLKLKKLPELQSRLNQIESKLDVADDAMKNWIDNPPEPLVDLRRPDSHRVTYVGRSTKNKHQDHWKDMAAVANQSTPENSTASFFRNAVTASDK
mmetsp:Transcript_21255/g.58857  ORF Transcript_21255/g.58857 Transcript_21255/m.58857 type:complete len:427 (+) Transcript_21255:41-1321(+)